MMNSSFSRACLLVATWACASGAGAQDTGTGPADSPQPPSVQAAGADTAAPTGKLARTISWATTRMDGRSDAPDGFYPELGGMITGAGFSAGPGYRHHVFGGQAILDASAAISWRRYTMMQSQLTWPRLWNDRLAVGGQVKYQDFTQVNFFGIGGDSLKRNQTDYRLKDLDALGFASVRANSWLAITGRTGLLRRVGIERGTSTLYPSTEELFNETSAPSLTRQPNYLHADVALDADSLDKPDYPSSGGRYRLSMATFHDQDFGSYSFRRIEADAAQYIPIGRTVFALRGRIDVSQTGDGQDVPFYLLPSLGGSHSLRGFSDYRFRDRDLLLVDAEYRWPLGRKVDAAMFYDTGTVAPSVGGLTHQRHSDYGAGIRVHSASHMRVRLDVARSSEGTRALLTFSSPLALPSRSVAPYVP